MRVTLPTLTVGTTAGVLATAALLWTAPAPAADFATRCAEPGVVRCYGFEDAGDIGDRTFGRSSDGRKLMFIDTAVKSSGNSSLRFDIPPLSPADTSGSFFLNFADDFSARFGAGQDLYVQWRQRFSPEMLRKFQGANGWKQVIVGAGDYPGKINYSCTEQETVFNQNTHSGPEGFPWVYHSCGNWETLEFDDGVQVRLQHQGPPYCYYPDDPDKGCMKYRANQWMTFQMHIKVVTWNQRNSTFEAWVSYEGQPSVRIYNSALTDGFIYYRTEDPNAFFGKIWLLPYNTNKSSAENHPEAHTWYDDLIISRNKIADPTSGPVPRPPSNVTAN